MKHPVSLRTAARAIRFNAIVYERTQTLSTQA